MLQILYLEKYGVRIHWVPRFSSILFLTVSFIILSLRTLRASKIFPYYGIQGFSEPMKEQVLRTHGNSVSKEWVLEKRNQHLQTLWKTFVQIFSNLILTKTPWGRFKYNTRFTDEKTEPQIVKQNRIKTLIFFPSKSSILFTIPHCLPNGISLQSFELGHPVINPYF